MHQEILHSCISDLQKVRSISPLVHNITNYVVMNSTANALLAIGASPVMAHAVQEVEEMVSIASSLVINIGTLSEHWIVAMERAMRKALEKNIPIILDPVGVGATSYRTHTARKLIEVASPTVIRGNASEILALAGNNASTKGVDSTHGSDAAVEAAQKLNQQTGSVICISGPVDYIIDKNNITKVQNGHPLMSRVTGMGCTATAIIGAFAAINPNAFAATIHAMVVMGIAGELAAKESNGPGSMQMQFFDMLFHLESQQIERMAKIESEN